MFRPSGIPGSSNPCRWLIHGVNQTIFTLPVKEACLFDLKIKTHLFETLCFAVDDTLLERVKSTDHYLSYQLTPYELAYVKKIIDTAHLIPERKADTTVQPLLRMLAVTFLFYLHNTLQEEPKNYPQWLTMFLNTLNNPDSFAKPLSELYALSTYSQRQLNTYFRKYMGTTIVAYMTKQKINYACNLLRTTNYTIIYIASLAGYTTLGHFNTIFKKQMGISPSEYRNQFRV